MDEEMVLKELSEGCVSFSSFNNDIVSKDMPIFYNPRMRENRDLSILMILYLLSSDSKKRRFAFPMTASGIRELRLLYEHKKIFENYPKESLIEFVVNDINSESLKLSKENITRANNNIVNMKYVRSDARSFLIENRHFDYVEIDPFGTPITFVDSALQSIKDNGIISITATDTSALTGTYPKATLRKYGSKIILNPSMHENAIRILASYIIKLGASHGLGLKILFSYSDEHYLKIFLKVKKGKGKADESLSLLKNIFICENCGMYYEEESACVFCSSKNMNVGPLFMGELWDSNVLEFINMKLDEKKDCEFSNILRKKMLIINEECVLMKQYNIRIDIHKLSSILKLRAVPKMDYIKNIIEDKKMLFSRSIFNDKMIRTNIKPEELKKILLNIIVDDDERTTK